MKINITKENIDAINAFCDKDNLEIRISLCEDLIDLIIEDCDDIEASRALDFIASLRDFSKNLQVLNKAIN